MPDSIQFVLRLLLFAAFHSFFARPAIKRLSGKSGEEAPWYRLAYNLLSLVILIWAMACYRHSPVIYFARGVWSLVMYLVQALVVVMLVSCVRQTGVGDFLGVRRWDANRRQGLCTGGYYAVVRHPLYLLSIVFMVLNPVMTAQWLLLTVLATAYFLGGALLEEKRLLAAFGDEYRRYRERVPFILPRLSQSG